MSSLTRSAFVRIAGTITVGAAIAACTDAGSNPVAPEFASPRMALSSTVNVNQYLELEKKRIKVASERSKSTYDSLKKEWERLNKRYPKGNSELLYCDPLQYQADTKIIGKEGGDMSIGPHKLSIPKGALDRPTVITGEMPVSLNVGVQLSQHGLQFLKDVKLTLSYKHCNRPNTFTETVVYVDDNGRILERPRSVDKGKDGLVEALIRHFSGYMVSGGRHMQEEMDF